MDKPLFYVNDHLGLGSPDTYAVYPLESGSCLPAGTTPNDWVTLIDVHDKTTFNMTRKMLDDQLVTGNWKKVER